ncbi:UMP-CMP kinase [Calocera cornea HHB12733]|uniref:Uridylate kinase n=1 Tax=Calocera cornea HHB12733 TaxID=1353952 RepID=A0A165H727_9BASI|nr:UMP-CMP kinase [Calocera cornea HHB12733]
MPTILDKVQGVFAKKEPAEQSTTALQAAALTNPEGIQAATQAQGTTPAFDHAKVTVIFVLGGPGAGKGTQCDKLVKDYGFVHLSAGDLLRAEQNRPGSQYGSMIREYIREGQIVPMEVTIKLLENAMRAALESPQAEEAGKWKGAWEGGRGRFLIDGFPRKMDQAIKFDEDVCKSGFVLFLSTTEAVLLHRLLERGKTSGREDDNPESISKRFRTFEETSMPVVEYYRERMKVVEIDSSPPIDEVYAKIRIAVDAALAMVAP